MGKKIQIIYEVDSDEFSSFGSGDGKSDVTLETVSDTDLVDMASDRWGHDMSIFMKLKAVVRTDGRRIEVSK